jgi:predicted nucleic acid-binding protein
MSTTRIPIYGLTPALEAERISHKLALVTTCRAFDLLHVAIAKVSRLTEFATLDADQKKVAVAAGLTLADLPE